MFQSLKCFHGPECIIMSPTGLYIVQQVSKYHNRFENAVILFVFLFQPNDPEKVFEFTISARIQSSLLC